jgi:hypothetical protein
MEDLVKCSKCLELKSKNDFTIRLDRKIGRHSSCRECANIATRRYKKSKEGLIRGMYIQEKRNSKQRKHNPPNYSLDEFRDWFYAQNNFEELYDEWVDSNYNKHLTPSVDRIDDLKPYTVENIRLVTWISNVKKSHTDKLNGVTGRDMKTVYKYDKDLNFIESYHSASYAAKQNNVSQTTISQRCLKYPKMYFGFYWTYNKLN